MAVEVRKWVTFTEEILSEGGRDLERPIRRVAIAAVIRNPYASGWSDDLQLIDAGEILATSSCAGAGGAGRQGRGLR